MEDKAISRLSLSITFTIPQTTHSTQPVATRKIHLQEEMSVENPGGRVHSPPNIQRSNHNHTQPNRQTPMINNSWRASECVYVLCSCLAGVSADQNGKMDMLVWASSPVVLAHCTFGLSLFKAPHICVTGNSRAPLHVAVQT